MLHSVFERASEGFLLIVEGGLDECLRLKNRYICTEHLLLSLMRDADNLPNLALSSMSINLANIEEEVDKLLFEKIESEEPNGDLPEPNAPVLGLSMRQSADCGDAGPAFSKDAANALMRAEDYARFLGYEEIEPEHLILGIIEQSNSGAATVFEELSINLIFLKRQVMRLIAREAALTPDVLSLKEAAIRGLKEIIAVHERYADALSDLAQRSQNLSLRIPAKPEILHMVLIGFLSDFLFTQIAFQRYLLEETVCTLAKRAGTLDQEVTASIVSSGAQNMRAQVRGTIEYLLSHECRLLTQMLSDAEYDLIGSVIEDLWWAQSEEIALNELFGEAMDDHRRKQLLNVQKRRVEISLKLSRLKSRLDETIRQCFARRTASA